jgi:hypothetical protein
MKGESREKKLRELSTVNVNTGCWEWIGAFKDGRYGQFCLNGKKDRAHRQSWRMVHGEIPAGMCVLHSCDNPSCVNPDHLFLGTKLDNATDMVSKGRSARGESASKTKLTEDQARFIKDNYIRGSRSMGAPSLGKMFGITHQAVQSIVNGQSWKYLC